MQYDFITPGGFRDTNNIIDNDRMGKSTSGDIAPLPWSLEAIRLPPHVSMFKSEKESSESSVFLSESKHDNYKSFNNNELYMEDDELLQELNK